MRRPRRCPRISTDSCVARRSGRARNAGWSGWVGGRGPGPRRALAVAVTVAELPRDGAGSVGGCVAIARCEKKYEEEWRSAGLGQIHDDPEVVAARTKASHVQNALVDALDDWSAITPDPGRENW